MFKISALAILPLLLSVCCLAQNKGLLISPNVSAATLWVDADELSFHYGAPPGSQSVPMVNKATRGSKTSFGINLGYMISPNFGIMSGFNVTTQKWKFHAESFVSGPKYVVDRAVSETFYEFPLYLRFVSKMKKLNAVMIMGGSYLALQKGKDKLSRSEGNVKTETTTTQVFDRFKKDNATTFMSVGIVYSPTGFLQIELTPELQVCILPTLAELQYSRVTTLGARLSVGVLPFNIE
jgi:hypothetical protein